MLPRQALKIPIEGYPKQIEFIQNKDYLKAFFGGWGCGKTHIGALNSLVYILANPGANGMITAPNYRLLLATFDKYLDVFPPQLIKRKRRQPPPEVELKANVGGSKLHFWSTDKPETIQAIEIAFAHMDEAGLSPSLAFRNIRARMRQRRPDGSEYPYQIWPTTTPRQLNWLYKEFVEKKRFYVQASTRENIYINAEDYIDRIGVSGAEAEQNIEGQFVTLAGDCLFNSEALQRILENDCQDPLDIENHGLILIWKKPVFGVNYRAGADCADEGGEGVNDCIITEDTGEEVAEIYGNIPADYFASLVYETCTDYNKAFLGVECNGTAGGTILTKLDDMGYKNLYRREGDKLGWNTGFANRFDPLLTEYKEAVEHRQTIIRNSDAVGEMSTFIRNVRGKYEHLEGYMDDRIMARAICWQMRGEGSQSREIGCHSFEYRESI